MSSEDIMVEPRGVYIWNKADMGKICKLDYIIFVFIPNNVTLV